QNGVIYAGPTGTFPVWGPVYRSYSEASSTRGAWGWPVSAPTCARGSCVQNFEGGYLATAGSSVYPVTGSIAATYAATGGPTGPLGAPKDAGAPQAGGARGDGFAQGFENGVIYSGPDGTYSVSGAF